MFKRFAPVPVFVSFFIYAAILGSLFPRIGDIQLKMGLGEGALGLAITGIPAGVQISLLFADRILNFLSFTKVMTLGLGLIGMSYSLAVWGAFATAGSVIGIWMFFFILLLAGLAIGVIEVAVNLEADRIEYATGIHLMNRAHAFWSLGFFTTAIIGASSSQFGISVLSHLSGLGVGIFLISIWCFYRYEQAPARPSDATAPPLFVRPTRAIMVLVFLTLSAMLAEGAAIDWSVIFMRDMFNSLPLTSGMALALAAFFQFIVRFNADRFVEQFGAYAVALCCLWLLLTGAALIVFSPVFWIALSGFALLGAGSSVIFPLAMSAAAQLKDRTAATNVASLAQISFVIFLLAPPLLGIIAEHFGIRYSFALVLPLVLLSFMHVRGLSASKG